MFNSYQHSGSYDDLLKLMTQHAQKNEIDNQIVEILKQFFEEELSKENMGFHALKEYACFNRFQKQY